MYGYDTAFAATVVTLSVPDTAVTALIGAAGWLLTRYPSLVVSDPPPRRAEPSAGRNAPCCWRARTDTRQPGTEGAGLTEAEAGAQVT